MAFPNTSRLFSFSVFRVFTVLFCLRTAVQPVKKPPTPALSRLFEWIDGPLARSSGTLGGGPVHEKKEPSTSSHKTGGYPWKSGCPCHIHSLDGTNQTTPSCDSWHVVFGGPLQDPKKWRFRPVSGNWAAFYERPTGSVWSRSLVLSRTATASCPLLNKPVRTLKRIIQPSFLDYSLTIAIVCVLQIYLC